jgi:hypothetical protein
MKGFMDWQERNRLLSSAAERQMTKCGQYSASTLPGVKLESSQIVGFHVGRMRQPTLQSIVGIRDRKAKEIVRIVLRGLTYSTERLAYREWPRTASSTVPRGRISPYHADPDC